MALQQIRRRFHSSSAGSCDVSVAGGLVASAGGFAASYTHLIG